VDLHDDLPESYGPYIDKLASSLQSPAPVLQQSLGRGASRSQQSKGAGLTAPRPAVVSGALPYGASRTNQCRKRPSNTSNQRTSEHDPNGSAPSQQDDKSNSFLALCINTDGAYKVCSEIRVGKATSDASLFLDMKRQSLAKRGRWSKFNYFVRPTTLEYIQVCIALGAGQSP